MNLKKLFYSAKNGLDKLSTIHRKYSWEKCEKNRVDKNQTLTAHQRNEIRLLYKSIHKRINFYSHIFYTAKTGMFDKRYIPDSIWYAYIEPFYNNRELAKSLDTKVLYDRILRGGVKHPETLAFRVNGYFIDGSYRHITINEILKKASNYSDIFVKKAEDSAGGHGVLHFSLPHETQKLNAVLSGSAFNIVVQAGLHQHKEMGRLSPSSVNTIRILSHLTKDGIVKIRSVVVRMGRNGSFVDNASSGGVTVGVLSDGRLKEIGYDKKGNSYLCHPDTGTKFSSVVIPNFTKVLESIKTLQWQLTQFRLLSWDIAIDELGEPVLIEVNMHSGQLDFHQLNNGPVFGDDTENVLEEVFN